MEKPLVSIVILNWNGVQHLKTCLPSLFQITYPNFEIIIVDMASTDGSLEYIREHSPAINIVRQDRNVGFAVGNNIGFKNSKGEIILFLNNDTKVEPDFLGPLVKVLNSAETIGCCQCKLLRMEAPDTLDLVGTFLTTTGFLYYYGFFKKDSKRYNKNQEIFFAKGSAMATKRKVLEEVGLMDEDFVTYFEEYDLCWRVQLAGYKILFVPTSVVYHKGWATSAKLPQPYKTYLTFKNRLTSLTLNLSFPYILRILPVHISLYLAFAFYYLFKSPRNSWAVIKSIFANILDLKRTLKKRDHVQTKIRKVSDDELLSKNMKKMPLRYYYCLLTDMSKFEDIEI